MYFYHPATKSVCAGRTLALCVSADFCQQSQNSPISGNLVEVKEAPSDLNQNNPASGVSVSPADDIFAPVTPVTGSFREVNSVDRIQRNLMTGTGSPAQVTQAPKEDKPKFNMVFRADSAEMETLDVSFYLKQRKVFTNAPYYKRSTDFATTQH